VSQIIEDLFPALRGRVWSITSPSDEKYNCIAWAAGDWTQPWWPDAEGAFFWPAGVARAATLDACRDAFITLGYAVCDDDHLEPGFEKVALFALVGAPKHAARQLPSGRWTSKLGKGEDIEHALHDLTGMVYGSVVVVMKRPIP
jgi:hypothetical protein